MKKNYWVIDVSCWGTLYGIGTEEQAEEWRSHKANWEHCVAKKREATEEEITSKKWRELSELL